MGQRCGGVKRHSVVHNCEQLSVLRTWSVCVAESRGDGKTAECMAESIARKTPSVCTNVESLELLSLVSGGVTGMSTQQWQAVLSEHLQAL